MKWFTYCSNVDTVTQEASQWRKHTTHANRSRRYRGSKPSAAFGLLLHSDDPSEPITETDVTGLHLDPIIDEFFPNGFIVLPADNENDRIITSSMGYVVLPDAATTNTPLLRIVDGGVEYPVDLRQRYNNCLSLVKVVGCGHCPDKGLKCATRDVLPEHVASYGNQPDDERAKELLVNRKTQIGPFTYVSPKLTIPEKHVFVPSYRHYADHDFSRIADNSESISDACVKAADGRMFKKKHCSRCPVKMVCSSYRTCAGPYPPSDEIVRQLLDQWKGALADGPFEPWQFWAIARSGGNTGKWLRKQVILSGLEHTTSGWRVNVWRGKCDIRRLTSFTNYADLQTLFNLPGEERVKEYAPGWGRPESDLAVALYLQLTEHTHSRMLKGGWGGSYYSLVSKRLESEGVRVRFGGPHYLRHTTDITSFASFRQEIDPRLGVPQERVRGDGYSAG